MGPRRDPDLIVSEELAGYSTMMLADAIRQLRPRWMSVRGSATGNTVPVVMDGGSSAGLDDPGSAPLRPGALGSLSQRRRCHHALGDRLPERADRGFDPEGTGRLVAAFGLPQAAENRGTPVP